MTKPPQRNFIPEFLTVVMFLTAWFILQYLLIRPPGLQHFGAIASGSFVAAIVYGIITYWIFYACVRKRNNPTLFLNVSSGVAILGTALWCAAQFWGAPKRIDPGYVSILHLPLNMMSAAILGLITDPIFLLPLFALLYRKKWI